MDQWKVYQCGARTCRNAVSITTHTFFSGARLELHKILQICWLWVHNTKTSATMNMVPCNSTTAKHWYDRLEDIVSWDTHCCPQEDGMIGGVGTIVEVDESKFGRRHGHRGHRVLGQWVVGGVERTEARRLFLVCVGNRTATTLMNVLNKYVVKGSIVYVDGWAGYKEEEMIEAGFYKDSVNHTYHFVQPETGVHTNTIEGSWNGIKQKTSARKYSGGLLQDKLFDYIWRRRHNGRLWDQLMGAMGRLIIDWPWDNDTDGDN